MNVHEARSVLERTTRFDVVGSSIRVRDVRLLSAVAEERAQRSRVALAEPFERSAVPVLPAA